jgi:CRP-like cAMP-binding protein
VIENIAPLYRVWGIDNIAYGPVELPELVSWLKQERVLSDTWIYTESSNAWTKAAELPELKALFNRRQFERPSTGIKDARITPAALRRIKMLATADDKVLESILRYLEPVEVRAFAILARPGDPADAMYFLLEGELRAYVLTEGLESTLATLTPGDSFGEIALLDHGPRSAFVAANRQSLLLKLSSSSFSQILREAPALGAPFALGLARALAGRIRGLTKRYEDSVHFGQVARLSP